MKRIVEVGLTLLITLIIGYLVFITPFYFISAKRMDTKTILQQTKNQQNREEIARFLESH